jgi:hypothetical protein
VNHTITKHYFVGQMTTYLMLQTRMMTISKSQSSFGKLKVSSLVWTCHFAANGYFFCNYNCPLQIPLFDALKFQSHPSFNDRFRSSAPHKQWIQKKCSSHGYVQGHMSWTIHLHLHLHLHLLPSSSPPFFLLS